MDYGICKREEKIKLIIQIWNVLTISFSIGKLPINSKVTFPLILVFNSQISI